jgi:hypothetical protein
LRIFLQRIESLSLDAVASDGFACIVVKGPFDLSRRGDKVSLWATDRSTDIGVIIVSRLVELLHCTEYFEALALTVLLVPKYTVLR